MWVEKKDMLEVSFNILKNSVCRYQKMIKCEKTTGLQLPPGYHRCGKLLLIALICLNTYELVTQFTLILSLIYLSSTSLIMGVV